MWWKNQNEQLIKKKLQKIMYILRNLNKVLKLPKLYQVYLELVQSIISYTIIGWDSISKIL